MKNQPFWQLSANCNPMEKNFKDELQLALTLKEHSKKLYAV